MGLRLSSIRWEGRSSGEENNVWSHWRLESQRPRCSEHCLNDGGLLEEVRSRQAHSQRLGFQRTQVIPYLLLIPGRDEYYLVTESYLKRLPYLSSLQIQVARTAGQNLGLFHGVALIHFCWGHDLNKCKFKLSRCCHWMFWKVKDAGKRSSSVPLE